MRVSVILGAVVVIGGIFLGNASADLMVDSTKPKIEPGIEKPMFSTGAELDEPNVYQERSEAMDKYLESKPEGRLYGGFRLGQILPVIGVLIWVVGALFGF